MYLNHRGIQVRNGRTAEIDDAIVIEDRFRIFFNDSVREDTFRHG